MAKYEEANSRICVELWDLSTSKDRTLKTCKGIQSLSIPEWKWEDIFMDFMTGLPRGKKGNDAIWMVVD